MNVSGVSNVGIGDYALRNNTAIRNTAIGDQSLAYNTASGNWLVNSDKRLKKNIKSLNSQEILQKVLSMRGVNYEWNDGDASKIRPTGIQFGFIAQELQEVFPTKVKPNANGLLSATYGDFDPILVESIKALKELIDEQQKMIEVLKNKVEILSA